MTLSITVEDNLSSQTVRTEADGRIFNLSLTATDPRKDEAGLFDDKAAVEAYINSIANDDPRWVPQCLIGTVNDDLTSKWYIIAPDGSFDKQCKLTNWNPLRQIKFLDKDDVETFVQSDVVNNPNYWSDYQTEAEEKAEATKFEAIVVREKRDALLNKYEWTVNSPDLTTAKQTEWKTYRQALRDLPDQSGFPWAADGMTWPTKPTS